MASETQVNLRVTSLLILDNKEFVKSSEWNNGPAGDQERSPFKHYKNI